MRMVVGMVGVEVRLLGVELLFHVDDRVVGLLLCLLRFTSIISYFQIGVDVL